MSAAALPQAVAALAADVAGLPGVVAVVLGGSRANNTHRPDSDWDLGVFYRASQQPLDPADVRALAHPGYVSELGEWGPIVNGGAWLTVADLPVDLLFRDLDTVEQWLGDALRGEFEVLQQTGYLAGAPTYVAVGELAIAQPIAGQVPTAEFPDALAATVPRRWEARAATSLMFASQHAAMGDAVACAGMLAHATLGAAHARLAQRREWVLNEKRLVQRAGLDGVAEYLPAPGAGPGALADAVAGVAATLGIEPLAAR